MIKLSKLNKDIDMNTFHNEMIDTYAYELPYIQHINIGTYSTGYQARTQRVIECNIDGKDYRYTRMSLTIPKRIIEECNLDYDAIYSSQSICIFDSDTKNKYNILQIRASKDLSRIQKGLEKAYKICFGNKELDIYENMEDSMKIRKILIKYKREILDYNKGIAESNKANMMKYREAQNLHIEDIPSNMDLEVEHICVATFLNLKDPFGNDLFKAYKLKLDTVDKINERLQSHIEYSIGIFCRDRHTQEVYSVWLVGELRNYDEDNNLPNSTLLTEKLGGYDYHIGFSVDDRITSGDCIIPQILILKHNTEDKKHTLKGMKIYDIDKVPDRFVHIAIKLMELEVRQPIYRVPNNYLEEGKIDCLGFKSLYEFMTEDVGNYHVKDIVPNFTHKKQELDRLLKLTKFLETYLIHVG